MPQLSKFIFRTILKLEFITYGMGVPLGVLFIIVGAGFSGDKLFSFIKGVLIAVTYSQIFPIYKYMYLSNLLNPISDNQNLANKDLVKIKTEIFKND